MSENKWYDEESELPPLWGWLIIIAFSASIMAFGWLMYLIIPDATRQWDFGALPDTPAESIYSSEQPKASMQPQRQLLRLPEALPDKPNPSEPKERERKP
jgi:hypothetical protein